ncbi:snoRNA-binding rRNA-processing protein UTP10 [Apiospora saccharicola]|uniref:U3 small nucleolar RNA-associated protein 10 n=1 Tax=Apiospora saccharicola TaxID=335842 RepID=A0ABR1WJB4_9PEZI
MATSLAAQLQQIAASSKATLDVKAQKAAHTKSLISGAREAASQNFQELYTKCRQEYDELCRIDGRFLAYSNTLFSEQSRDEDRTQMTTEENAELDSKIDSFLRLVGGRLRISPAIYAVEWLVRRFKIHEFNTVALITTFLPYHTELFFVKLLTILPATLPQQFRFLDPYVRTRAQLPKTVLVLQATNHSEFLASISEYTLEACRHQQHHAALINLWRDLMTQAVNGMLDKMRSGRRSIQLTNDQDLMHQIGPILSEALVMKTVPEIQVACYTVVYVLAAKGNLQDQAITALMEQLVIGWTNKTVRPGLATLSVLAQYRSSKQLSRKVTKALLDIDDLPKMLDELPTECNTERLCNGFCVAAVERVWKKAEIRGLPLVESIILKDLLSDLQRGVIFKSLLLAAHRIDGETDEQGQARHALASTIVRLSHTGGSNGEVFTKAIADLEVDIEELEMKLDVEIRPKTIAAPEEDVQMDGDEDKQISAPSEDFETGFNRLNEAGAGTIASCLLSSPPDVFADICSVYMTAVTNPEHLAKFEEVAPLQGSEAHSNPFFFTFFMRMWCGPYPALARVNALEMVKNRLKSTECGKYDPQALIPYSLVALNDPARKVRRAAADLLAVIDEHYGQNDTKTLTRWGGNKLYESTSAIEWMSSETSRKFLQGVLIPTLEECVLNADHINAVIQTSLNSSKSRTSDGASKDKKAHLSQNTRLSVMTCLAGHIIQTPILLVKSRLLRSLNQVKSVSGTNRTAMLLPLLEWWISLPADAANSLCQVEHIDVQMFNKAIAEIVVANDNAGLDFLFEAINKPELSAREGLVQVLFEHIQKMWPAMKSDAKHAAAERLLALAQEAPLDERSIITTEAANLLRTVELPTEVLHHFLDTLQSTDKLATEPPAGKRRRTSSTSDSRANVQVPDLSLALKQVTFVLQLVDGSEAGKHPSLLNPLFNTLSQLQQYRAILGSELGYLQSLVLQSLLSILETHKDNKDLKIDSSGGHGDLLVNCIQRSSSPAVQNKALLLVASLAKIAPELVLHSVMPIFTFMGSSTLRNNDNYSAHVINEIVKEVVPPLIQSLRKGKKSPIAGASELLLSFVTAYEHIPTHRRLGLFISLLETLGAEDFLFALLAMLSDKYGSTADVLSFSTGIFNNFSVEIGLHSLIKLLHLIGDLFKPKPGLSASLLGTSEESNRDPQKIAASLLDLPPQLLSSKKLTAQIRKITESDDMDAARVRELYSTLLEDLLSLAENLKPHQALHVRCGDTLPKLLNLLPIGEFIKAVENLLDRPDIVIRRKVLRAVEVRIDQESQANANSRTAILAFLPQLTAILRTTDDILYKYVAVECVDKISEKYGKKDPEAVTAAAAIIAGDQCLGQPDNKLREMALLCLASIVDVLQDGMLEVLPTAFSKCLAYMKESISESDNNTKLHSAAFRFITALAEHLPYVISTQYLRQILAISSASAEAKLDSETNDTRQECLQFIAKRVDSKSMFTALETNWGVASKTGFVAIKEYLDILGMAIEKHTKADISKSVGSLSSIFMAALDLRRVKHVEDDANSSNSGLARTEEMVNAVAIRMIMKLNDAAFRPIFSELMVWASSDLPKSDVVGRNLRLQSVFNFLYAFFDRFGSIVTSYASYTLEPSVDVLKATNAQSLEQQRDLWRKVLQTLTKSFEHDQDDFWQAPAHFNEACPVLAAQFVVPYSGHEIQTYLVPAVVELAAAADSQEHQKELNGSLLKHLRSETAAVRLAAVKAEQSLTQRLGEDWLAMLPEMLPYISELQEDDDEEVERETQRWIVGIEEILGESLDAMLQ